MNLIVLISFLGALAGAYIIYFGLVAKPEYSIYAYLLIWMIVPKAFRFFYLTGGSYDLPEGITVFNLLETMSILSIIVALLKSRRRSRPIDGIRPLHRFVWLFWITGLVSLLVSFGFLSLIIPMQLDDVWNFLNLHSEIQYRFIAFASMIYGGIFLYGCVAFIKTMKQVEHIFLFFFWLGVGLGVESIIFYYLPLVSPAFSLFPSLSAWSVNQTTERFMSLIFTNIDQVGQFAIIAIGACLYFALTRKRKEILLALPLLMLPVLAGYQRSVAFGVLVTLVFIYWHASTSRKRLLYLFVTIALASTLYVFDANRSVAESVGSGLGGTTRSDYFSTETLAVRFGLQTRGVELLVHAFPFGVGPGMVATAMNSPIRQSILGNSFPQMADYSAGVYGQVASGIRTTNTHNIFLEFMVENGLLGILALAMFFFLLSRNFRLWLKTSRGVSRNDNRLFLAQLCIYGLLIGIGVHESFEATSFPYSIYMMFLYFSFLIPQLKAVTVGADQLTPMVNRRPLVPSRHRIPLSQTS